MIGTAPDDAPTPRRPASFAAASIAKAATVPSSAASSSVAGRPNVRRVKRTRYATPDTTQILHDWRENWREQPFRAPPLWASATTQHDQHHPENPVPDLLDVHTRDRTRDHELLDLGCSLEDVVDLRVAMPALDRELTCVAVAAKDLDCALGHPDGDLARL